VPFPDIDPFIIGQIPAFELFGLTIGPLGVRWYALAYVLGIVLGWRYALKLAGNEPLWGERGSPATPAQIDDLILWITLGIIGGGRLGYVLFYNTSMIWESPVDILKLWDGGMSFHGGLIGVVLAIWMFARSDGVRLLGLGDLVAAVVPIGLFFGRIANFINGELWGRVTEVPWGMVFRHAGALPRHPSQLYQFALEGVALFVLLWWYSARPRPLGRVSGAFLVGYGVFRFVAEFTREPDAFLGLLALGLTMGQWLCLPMIAAGVALLAWPRR